MYTQEFCIYQKSILPVQEIYSDQKKRNFFEKTSLKDKNTFWQFWQQYQDYFYHRCLQWMNGNPDEAQEALSQAMLKGWEKFPEHQENILNVKAWLSKLIYNLCVDLHRQRDRERRYYQNVRFALTEYHYRNPSYFESPETELVRYELLNFTRNAIGVLPANIRIPFVLHCYKHYSYLEISQQLTLSQENIRKRVQQARKILQKKINQYLSGLENLDIESTYSLSEKWQELENLDSDRQLSDWKELEKQKNTNQQIDYQVSVICLETLPHGWYLSPSPLVWR
ncbi:MAG: RNA polymerase sigma factor [Cyanobacteria bacterium P01_A01_bin.84]